MGDAEKRELPVNGSKQLEENEEERVGMRSRFLN